MSNVRLGAFGSHQSPADRNKVECFKPTKCEPLHKQKSFLVMSGLWNPFAIAGSEPPKGAALPGFDPSSVSSPRRVMVTSPGLVLTARGGGRGAADLTAEAASAAGVGGVHRRGREQPDHQG
jgi:hypothetical protein